MGVGAEFGGGFRVWSEARLLRDLVVLCDLLWGRPLPGLLEEAGSEGRGV